MAVGDISAAVFFNSGEETEPLLGLRYGPHRKDASHFLSLYAMQHMKKKASMLCNNTKSQPCVMVMGSRLCMAVGTDCGCQSQDRPPVRRGLHQKEERVGCSHRAES